MIDKQLYLSNANLINKDLYDWKKVNINDLINDTFKHINSIEYDSYVSALILRLWDKIKTIKYNTSNKLIEYDDIYEILINAILDTIKIIQIINNDKPKADNILKIKERYENDKNYPMKLLNLRIKRHYLSYLKYLDADKRKTDYQEDRLELDKSFLDEQNDDSISDTDNYQLPSINYESGNDITDYISKSFKNKDYDTGIVLDSIINNDKCFSSKHTRIKSNHNRFQMYSLITILQNLDNKTINDISNEYNIKDDEFVKYCNDIKVKSNYKLKNMINNTISKLKSDMNLYYILQEN